MKKLLAVFAFLALAGLGGAIESARPHREGPHEPVGEQESPERSAEKAKAREQKTTDARAKLAKSMEVLLEPNREPSDETLRTTIDSLDDLYPEFDAEMVRRIQAEHRSQPREKLVSLRRFSLMVTVPHVQLIDNERHGLEVRYHAGRVEAENAPPETLLTAGKPVYVEDGTGIAASDFAPNMQRALETKLRSPKVQIKMLMLQNVAAFVPDQLNFQTDRDRTLHRATPDTMGAAPAASSDVSGCDLTNRLLAHISPARSDCYVYVVLAK